MTYHHSANKTLLVKRILFLCISFVIISATHLHEPEPLERQELVYSSIAKEGASVIQEAALYPDARVYQADCEVY